MTRARGVGNERDKWKKDQMACAIYKHFTLGIAIDDDETSNVKL